MQASSPGDNPGDRKRKEEKEERKRKEERRRRLLLGVWRRTRLGLRRERHRTSVMKTEGQEKSEMGRETGTGGPKKLVHVVGRKETIWTRRRKVSD